MKEGIKMVENLDILVKRVKKDNLALMDVLERLQPLIKSYTKKLFFMDKEDAEQETILAIIEAIHCMENSDSEGCCLVYLKNAVFFRYCALCKKNIKRTNKEVLNDMAEDFEGDYVEDYKMVELNFDLQETIKKQKLSITHVKIISLALRGYSDKDISTQLGMSRQYVNRIRKRILTQFTLNMKSM